MTTPPQASRPLPLFYQNPVALDSTRHAGAGIKMSFGLGFAAKVNAVPINIVEFPQACHYYPIAFSPDASATPVAIVGIRNEENLFVNKKGEWNTEEAPYIPAYVRRYPFIFSEIPGMDRFSLCIDDAPQIIEQNAAHKFFDAEGKPTELTNNALEFCKSYHVASQQTLEFCKQLNDSGLLVPREAQIQVADGRKMNFTGFRIVDEAKLAQIDNDTFIKWRIMGWLPFIYAHLFSGAQWQRINKLLSSHLKKEAA